MVERTRELILRYAVFFVGMTFIALGIVLGIQAQLGVNAWDILNVGLSNITPFTVGTWSVLTGLIFVVVTVVLTRRRPTVGCLMNMLYIGACIDFIFYLDWVPAPVHWLGKSLMMFIGLAMMGFGSGMYVAAERGAGPRDGLTLALAVRTGWSIRKVRVTLELTVLVIGWSMGGPVFIGTVLAALTVGPMMQFSLRLWKQWIERMLRRGVVIENLNQGAIRVNHHDGLGRQLR